MLPQASNMRRLVLLGKNGRAPALLSAPSRGQHSMELRFIPQQVKIYEMGPRDGLQNEAMTVPTPTKIDFINALSSTGLRYIEASSFVSKQWVPQMGDAEQVCAGITRADGVVYSALVPNMKGMEAALAAGLTEVAVFAAATDSFSKRNINCNVMDSFDRFKPVLAAAKAHGVRVVSRQTHALGTIYRQFVRHRVHRFGRARAMVRSFASHPYVPHCAERLRILCPRVSI